MDKRREKPNQAEAMNIIGDVRDKFAIVVDDMVDTAGTLVTAGEALYEKGAKSVMACITHPVLSGPAVERLANSKFSQLVFTEDRKSVV